MFFKEDKDWKDELGPEAKEILATFFDKTRKHKYAYSEADDVKSAQLWCALIEMKKEMDGMKQMVKNLEAPFRAIVEVGNAEKKKTIERLVSEMVKPVDEESQNATKRLVDSLMKF